MYHQVTRFKKKTWCFRNTLNDKFCEFLFKHRNHKKSTCKIIHIYSLQV